MPTFKVEVLIRIDFQSEEDKHLNFQISFATLRKLAVFGLIIAPENLIILEDLRELAYPIS